MKPVASLALFGTLVFGVGWTSHHLAGRITDGSKSHRRSSCSRGLRCGSQAGGPYLQSVEELAGEIGLSQGQRRMLDQWIADTRAAVAGKEGEIYDLLQETREKIQSLLEPQQQKELDRLLHEKWSRYRAQKVLHLGRWLEAEAGLDSREKSQAVEIVERFEERKAEFFVSTGSGGGMSYEEVGQRMRELADERDKGLEKLLPPEDLERFASLSRQWQPSDR